MIEAPVTTFCPCCGAPTFPCPTPKGFQLACEGWFEKHHCEWVSLVCLETMEAKNVTIPE